MNTREWARPVITDWSYISLKALARQVRTFASMVEKENARSLLDLGCGAKPYRPFFPHIEKYIGFDIAAGPEVDVVGKNWDLPFANDEFDALLTTQVLEHTAKLLPTVQEIQRVVKTKGLIFVSAPLTYPEHGVPYDYYRFTRYGLLELFRDFTVVHISSSGGFLSTLCKLHNVFWNYFPYARYWAWPLFLFNNIVGLAADFIFSRFSKSQVSVLAKAADIYMRMPENFMIVLRNTKP